MLPWSQILPPPRFAATSDLFFIPTILPFPECHVRGIIQYGIFWKWLLSLPITFFFLSALGLFYFSGFFSLKCKWLNWDLFFPPKTIKCYKFPSNPCFSRIYAFRYIVDSFLLFEIQGWAKGGLQLFAGKKDAGYDYSNSSMNSKECSRGTVHLGTTSKVLQWLAFVIHTFLSSTCYTNYLTELLLVLLFSWFSENNDLWIQSLRLVF